MVDPFPVPKEFALRALAATPGEEIDVRYLGGAKRPAWIYLTWERERAAGMIRDAGPLLWDFGAQGGYQLRMDYYGREYWVRLEHPPLPPVPTPPPPVPDPEPEPDPEPPVVPDPVDPPADPEPDPEPEPPADPEPGAGDPDPEPTDPGPEPTDPPADPEQPGNN